MAEPVRAERRPARRRGIRARITTLATLIVAIALLLGATAFWVVLRTSLYDQLTAAAGQDAVAYAALVDESPQGEDGDDHGDSLPGTLPDVDDDRFWQLVDGSGAVVDASDVADGVGPLAGGGRDAPSPLQFDDGGTFVAATARESDVVVVAGRSTAQIDATLLTVAVLLAVSVPVVAGVVAATTWLAVGRSLAPVERMRREVEQVSATDLSRRVDDPATADELSSLARTLNAMLVRLEHAHIAQRRFVSDASHELRSPLASMRQFAEVAAAYPDRVSREELADVVLAEGARLEDLVEGMLVLTRADEKGLGLHLASLDLSQLARHEAPLVPAAPGVRVEVAAESAVPVPGDAGMLRRVVRNLTANAVRHARSRVAIAVGTDSHGPWLTVDDDGPGIPPADRERVFERFVRLDDARSRDAGGSGLGLAIVREIVHAHGGTVRADASALGGARFAVRLPR